MNKIDIEVKCLKLNLIFILLIFCNFKININIKNNFYEIFPKKNINDITNNLHHLFNSRELIIKDLFITNKYIYYIRNITNNKEHKNKNNFGNIVFTQNYFHKREDQFNFKEFGKKCIEEKLLNNKKIIENKEPIISIILSSYNREKNIIKSIRSIQNQSLKNIEIIIVDDFSTDNSFHKYKYLLKEDPRIRIFYHTKNMGLWRSRIDGFLYSRGKYIIFFDPDDLYEDNYILEDSFNVINYL